MFVCVTPANPDSTENRYMAKKTRTLPALAGEQLRRWVEAEFEVEDHQRPLLDGAAVQADRAAAFRRVIDDEGEVVTDRFGQRRIHPAVDAERKALDSMRLLLRELGLSTLDADEARPPRITGRYVQEG
jgi:phage terminase small subunit